MTATDPQSLPLDVALQQAVAHHQAGRLQEAEQLYRAILQAQPDQPDANHNLGLLAGQVGRHADGLPHLKAALDANPAQGQFWLSYADALLVAGQAKEALNIIQTAIQRGLDIPAAQELRQKAEAAVPSDPVKEEAPAITDLNQLIALFNAGRHAELEERARLLVERYPNSGFAWKILGAALQAQSKKSLPALQKAAELLPDDAEAHNNLGVALRGYGQLDAAAASYRRALEIEPGYAEAHNNLGSALQALGQLDAAVASYTQALALKPDYVDARNNLALARKDIEQRDRAEVEDVVAPSVKNQVPQSINSLAHIPFARLWLIFACLVVYVKFIGNPFVFDDHNMFDSKEVMQAYANSWFFDFNLRWFSYVTFGWTYKFVGTKVVWHRIISLALHVFVVLALYAFLKQLFQRALPAEEDAPHQAARFAFWGALIFAVHPVVVYGAGYLVERTIVMATLFSILALHAFVKGLSGDGRKWVFIAGAWYFIAVFSKEHSVMLPFAMVALIPLVRRDYRVLMRELALPGLLFFGIALLMALKSKGLLGTVYERHAMEVLAQAARSEIRADTVENAHLLSILLQGYLFFKYLLLWLVPNVGWMSVDMQQKFPHALLQWPESAGFLLFVAYPIAAGLLLWRGGKRGLLGYALLFPWIMFMTEFVAVRVMESFVLYRSYLWMACLPVALPALLGRMNVRRENKVLALLVLVLIALSWNRLNTFSNELKLIEDVIAKFPEEKTPGMSRAYLSRAERRWDVTQREEAMADYNKGIELNPQNPVGYHNRGSLKGMMGNYHDAYQDYNRAIELDPKYAEAFFNRAAIQLAMGNKEGALSDIAYAIALKPGYDRYLLRRDEILGVK